MNKNNRCKIFIFDRFYIICHQRNPYQYFYEKIYIRNNVIYNQKLNLTVGAVFEKNKLSVLERLSPTVHYSKRR